jgi:hypothetical protein
MENALIVINAADIPVAVQTARTLPSYVVYVFDPTLVDALTIQGIHRIEFIAWDAMPAYHEMNTNAHARAKTFELVVDQWLQTQPPGVSVQSWQHQNLYYFFMAYQWYSALWLHMLYLFENCRPHIFMCSSVVENYEASFLPALLLLQTLKTRGIAFEACSYDRPGTDVNVVMDLPTVYKNLQPKTLLVHLPACNYDFPYVNSELQASGKYVINTLAKQWNFPIAAHKHYGVRPITDEHDADALNKLQGVLDGLIRVLDDTLRPYIATPHFRALQAQHWANAYVGQLRSYELLIRYFGTLPPEKLLITDHDCGLHGPLLRFAEQFNIPVLLFPHSKTCGALDHSCVNTIALTHPIQGGVVSDADGAVVPRRVLCFPEQYTSPSLGGQGIHTVGVLLNAPSLNGICFAQYQKYTQGIELILAWGKVHNIQIKIRCKPGHSLIRLLERDCGADSTSLINNANATMDAFLTGCDICLMFDHPTSAAIHFLNKGAPTMLAVPRELSANEKTFVNLDVVPHGDMEAILHRLDTYRLEPHTFTRFRNNQFRDYLNLSREALALRTYL